MTTKPIFFAEDEIPEPLHQQLSQLLSSCFHGPHDAPFRVQSYWRVPPAWRWIIFDTDKTPVAQLTVHDLTVGTASGDLRLGMIADVCTLPACRGRGYAKAMLEAAHEWLPGEGVEFCFLCGEERIYGGSGYQCCDNPIRFQDYETGEWKTEPLDKAMVRPLASRPWPAGVIDLRGPTL